MDWNNIKNWLLDHKQYLLVLVVISGIVLWTLHANAVPDSGVDAEFKPVSSQTFRSSVAKKSSQPEKGVPSSSPLKTVTCDISGAVKHQGVYTLKNGARLQQLIAAAGGVKATAQLKNVNRALILHDQDKVHIPYRSEKLKASEIVSSVAVESAPTAGNGETATESSTQTASGNKINLNTASAQELQKLNGIGEKKAAEIIAYRQKNGQFKQIEDLKQVSGIGDKTFAALKNQVEI